MLSSDDKEWRRYTEIITVVIALVGLIWGFVIYFRPPHADNGPSPNTTTKPVTTTAAPTGPATTKSALPVTATATVPVETGEWNGTVHIPDGAAVDLDATPPFVDRLDPGNGVNDVTYEGDHCRQGSWCPFGYHGPFLKFAGSAKATKWTNAAAPTESQCREAIGNRGESSMFVDAGYQLCIRTSPPEGGTRYILVKVVVADHGSLSLEVTRWSRATAATAAADTGRSGWSMFWWTLLAFVLVGAIGFGAGIAESVGPALIAVPVAVGWLILMWGSMAWWLIVLLLILMVVTFVACSAGASEL
jgi:hypothetical protein